MIPPRPSWHQRAACRGMDPRLWFVEQGETSAHARKICRSCTVIDECAQFAESNGETEGVWGGRSRSKQARWKAARPTLVEGGRQIIAKEGTTRHGWSQFIAEQLTEGSGTSEIVRRAQAAGYQGSPVASRHLVAEIRASTAA